MNLQVCNVEGCFSPIYCREWCAKHYARVLRWGDPLINKNPGGESTSSMKSVHRLLRKIDYADNGCWEWNGSQDSHGYGKMNFQGRMRRTHVISFIIHRGSINEMLVLHSCDNRKCCNPEHLFLGTHADNCLDKVRKNRHARGRMLPTAKLTDALVVEIRKSKESALIMAKRYGVHLSVITHVKERRSWKHVQCD